MGKLGQWITNNTKSPFYSRKVIKIEKKVKSAHANVCGLGQFHFYINGKKVGDHELDPGWTNYNKYIQYVRFDVKEYLGKGQNVLGAEVGNGWFIKCDEHYTFEFPEFMPPNPNPYRPFGENLVLALSLELNYEDGTTDIITADESFKVKRHCVTMSNVYGSETIEGGLVQTGWNTVEFDDSEWENASLVEAEKEPKGELTEQFQPAIKVLQSYEGKHIHDFKNRKIYDLGQNMSGILEAEVFGKKGEEIKFYPAEKLTPDGDVDQMAKGWMEIDSCITYIVGEEEKWEKFRMAFTYFAGRYVAVEGGDIQKLQGDAITSAYVTTGSFTCDDKRYEKIYNIIEKAVEANMVSVHTDCPTIERFAWQEPNHLMAPSIMYMKDGQKLWEKFFLDMRADQHTKDDYFLDFEGNKVFLGEGLMPSQCPCYIPNVLPVPGMGSFYDIIPWGSTSILGVYWHYLFYGDKKVLEDNYDSGMRYLNYLKTKVNADGFLNHGIGDWGNPKNYLVRENIETAFLYADAIVLMKFAEILKQTEDANALRAYAKQVKDNYNQKLLVKHPTEGFYCYKAWDHPGEVFLTQASQALPLYWGMVPEKYEADLAKALRFTLEREGAFISGEVGLPYVIQSASRYGMNELISEFILKEEHPSYYAFVLDGETTLGEYWENNPRSHCHDMMGHIAEWYYNGIAGIIPQKAGFQAVKIMPHLPKTMTNFQCSFESVNGLISVCVKEEQERILLEVNVPKNIEFSIDTSNLESRGKDIVIVS
ncbi:family 78 glycoside hydrolase catalytic domain [Konateibacter massiliensis]|uniref:family 78 glycoside hydrolase catalytic domain n=1 Tax=Konateibacter massiliensis TaxID=2002841 RepID=UPI000C14B298|nr:family 78 glycoside hydrolase catalytic domain [Konateibacter massiliensis]